MVLILFGSPVVAASEEKVLELLMMLNTDKNIDSGAIYSANNMVRIFDEQSNRHYFQPLPESIKSEIFKCYKKSTSWSSAKKPAVDWYKKTFSDKEIQILINYHNRKILPPEDVAIMANYTDKIVHIQTYLADALNEDLMECANFSNKIIETHFEEKKP